MFNCCVVPYTRVYYRVCVKFVDGCYVCVEMGRKVWVVLLVLELMTMNSLQFSVSDPAANRQNAQATRDANAPENSVSLRAGEQCDYYTICLLAVTTTATIREQRTGQRYTRKRKSNSKTTADPGFHPNAIACVASVVCVAFGWKPG